MKEGDQVSLLQGEGAPGKSANTQLVAAALACGFEFHNPKRAWFHTIEQDPDAPADKVTWMMRADQVVSFKLANGKTDRIGFLEFARRWKDEAWMRSNLEHPMAYLYFGFAHYRALLHAIKRSVPTVLIRQGTRTAMVPADATPEKVREILELE
jgi:hypothetical protein